jgi:hypothetical protein
VTGWDSFEPWLSRMESFDPGILWELAGAVPPEWYGAADDELERMLDKLLARRAKVRDLLESFRESSRNPFPNWQHKAAVVM